MRLQASPEMVGYKPVRTPYCHASDLITQSHPPTSYINISTIQLVFSMKSESRYASPLVLIGDIPFFGRIIRSVIMKFFRATKLPFLVVSRMGVLFLVDQQNKVDRSLLVKGEWERHQIIELERLIREFGAGYSRSVFLDIGAHGGLYSILLKKLNLFDEIFAFEPDPLNLAQLHSNLLINSLTSAIKIIPCAASKADRSVGFVSCQGRHRGLSHMTDTCDVKSELAVQAVKVDSVVPYKGVFIVAKIDVEGFEADVLEGMREVIRDNACLLQIEIFQERLKGVTQITEEFGLTIIKNIENDHYFYKSLSKAE